MTVETGFVKSSLEKLISAHINDVDLECVDDILLNYVCGVVEEISTGDDIDPIGMKDVLCAYIPQFEGVPSTNVETWVRDLAQACLDEKEKEKSNRGLQLDSLILYTPQSRQVSSGISESSGRSTNVSERSDSSEESAKTPKEEVDHYSESLTMLCEMFPNSCNLEAQHCLNTCGGHVEDATSLLLERQEQGLSIKVSAVSKLAQKSLKLKDDKDVRSCILNKYAFIDKDDDRREHRPVAPKWEGKKLIRYRDNQIVSMKGERFTEVKRDDTDDLKKSVSSKSSKPYKFH